MGLDWYEELPAEMKDKWKQLFEVKELKQLNEVKFPRCLFRTNDSVVAQMLCVFSDASQNAFGACAYIPQSGQDNEINVKFVAAKSRVAPLKQMTIPRLGLQAAVLASRLGKLIQQESRIKFSEND